MLIDCACCPVINPSGRDLDYHLCDVRNPGADPEGGFGDLSPLNFLEVKII